MAKKEVRTDLWVYDLLKDAGITLDAQGSNIKELDYALKTASKKGTGNVGFPEYVGVVKDFVLVIEDKYSTDKQAKYDENGIFIGIYEYIDSMLVPEKIFYSGEHDEM